MANFNKKNWLSAGETGANESNSVLSKENMNDLENRIENAFNLSGLIEEQQTGDNGYIKFKNGIMLQWMEKKYTYTSGLWTSDSGLYYSAISAIPWNIAFKTLYFSLIESTTNQIWFTHGPSSTTNAAGGYIVTPSSRSTECSIKYVGFGTWK